MLYLRIDQARELLKAARTLREVLIVRYLQYNGFSPMEVGNARIEHMDPIQNKLFMPRRHWKNNCLADVDPETVRLQIIYCGSRKKGPLLRSRLGGHLSRIGIWWIVKQVAMRTDIPGKERICPLILKRTYARLFLKTFGNTIIELKKSFDHKHLAATARYLRFTDEEVQIAKSRMMERIGDGKTTKSVRQVPR